MTSPASKRTRWSLPPVLTSASRNTDKALTTDEPTPCRPPETLYESESNFPPACNSVKITSIAARPSRCIMPTGIPRPLSVTVAEPSAFKMTSTVSA